MARQAIVARQTALPKEHEVPRAWECIKLQDFAPHQVAPASIHIVSPAADGFVCATCGGGSCVSKTALAVAYGTRAVFFLALQFRPKCFFRLPVRRD